MSAALIRQALEFVDPEEGVEVRDKRRSERKRSSGGQVQVKPFKRPAKKKQPPKEQSTNQTIKKLLALSRPASNKKTAEKV